MRRVVLAWAMGMSTSVALALPAGTARACECAHQNPVQQLAEATVVVVGSVTDYADLTPDPQAEEPQLDRRWIVNVHQRFRGESADVIEVRLVEQSNCFAPYTIGPTLALGPPTSEGWFTISTCPMFPTAQELAYVFDEVPLGKGRGPPAMIAAAGTRDHTLLVLDGDGEALRYLPAPGPTRGLSICPGTQSFVQLRGRDWAAGAALELAVWSLVDWTEQRSVPIEGVVDDPFAFPPSTLVCLDQAATKVWRADGSDITVDTVTGATEPNPDEGLLESIVSDMTPMADVGAPFLSAVSLTDTGWRATGVYSDGSTGTTEKLADGSMAVSRLASQIPIVPFVAVSLDPAVAEQLDVRPGDAPLPLLERTGTRVEAIAPSLPPTTAIAIVTTASSQATVPTSESDKRPDTDAGWSTSQVSPPWTLIVVAVGVVALVVATLLVRSRERRGA